MVKIYRILTLLWRKKFKKTCTIGEEVDKVKGVLLELGVRFESSFFINFLDNIVRFQ